MSAFLDDITPFLGTGQKNEDGLDLASFLEDYDANKYPNPSVTSDILVFHYQSGFQTVEKGLKLLMIQRRNHPSIGYWALPGGFINIREDIDAAARRELEEETGVKDIPIEQLFCWGNYKRDPRTRIITLSYLAMIEENISIKAGDDAADALFFDVIFTKKGESKIIENRIFQNYELTLEQKEQKLLLHAVVEKSENCSGFLKQEEYKVISSDKIAFDHPCFIVQALKHIEKLLKQ